MYRVFVVLVEGDEPPRHLWARIILSMEFRPHNGLASRKQRAGSFAPLSIYGHQFNDVRLEERPFRLREQEQVRS